jgi:hypothetical protein
MSILSSSFSLRTPSNSRKLRVRRTASARTRVPATQVRRMLREIGLLVQLTRLLPHKASARAEPA